MSAPGHARSALWVVFKFLISFAAFLILAGFAVFVWKVSGTPPVKPVPKADGIVVLTGPGGGRLEAGARLLREKRGERLLISGVNPAINTRTKIQKLLALGDALVDCCVDLDYIAENTFDNGRETANWARVLGYEDIILVTSAYHMPRAKLEISRAISGIRITPYPVRVENLSGDAWWKSRTEWFRLVREYAKLLHAYAREPGVRTRTTGRKAV